MLDDLRLIHERDTQDSLGAAGDQWRQLEHEFAPSGNTSFSDVQNVVCAAMGGPAAAASLASSWPTINKPYEVVRGYELPEYVGANTLVIVASHSGNTEEALSALKQAEEKHAQIAIITAGGQLQQTAEEKGYLLLSLPPTRFTRCSTFYTLKAVLEVLSRAGVLHDDGLLRLKHTAGFLKDSIAAWLPDVATASNPAKQLAQELLGKSIVIYSGPRLYPVAYKWKINFNENAKQIAWTGQLPEFNHNEFTGWSKQPTDKPYAVIDLRSSLEHAGVQKRFRVSARLLSGMRPEPLLVETMGGDLAEQLLWSIVFGDFVSLYLALLNGINPTPLELVDKLKRTLAE
jgi:glucose/mannose-6-phosphate isomerase